MGGQALKQYPTQRISSKLYIQLLEKIRYNIELIFGENSFRELLYYRNKPDFGDMDFVLVTDQKDWKDKIISHWQLDSARYHSNGNVFSFGVDNFQIDCIRQSSDIANFAVKYYSYNDLGNFLGRLTHKLGMKLGHDGLWLVVRSRDTDTRILDKVLLTQDWYKVLDILGLSNSIYDVGFDNLEDVFEYVTSSCWFDPDIFLLDNRNNTSRVRDKKRKSYNQLLTYIKDLSGQYKFSNADSRGGHMVREPYYSTVILKHFPWVKARVNELDYIDQINQHFKQIYNGVVVSNYTGLHGRALGKFMSQFKWDLDSKKQLIKHPEMINSIISSKIGN